MNPIMARAIAWAKQGYGFEDLIVMSRREFSKPLTRNEARTIVSAYGGSHGTANSRPVPAVGSGSPADGNGPAGSLPDRPGSVLAFRTPRD